MEQRLTFTSSNGNSLFDGSVNGFGPGSGPSFATNLAVLQGDTIDFAVGIGSDGTYISDTTGLDATITTTTAVPEPASITLLGLSLLGLFGSIGWHRATLGKREVGLEITTLPSLTGRGRA